jgi:hypothetical protein
MVPLPSRNGFFFIFDFEKQRLFFTKTCSACLWCCKYGFLEMMFAEAFWPPNPKPNFLIYLCFQLWEEMQLENTKLREDLEKVGKELESMKKSNEVSVLQHFGATITRLVL